ncbi:MAG TPA: hypothetical protein VFP85_07845, partial [Vicinamibacterales bacterium]|nr:hypothetical protein [Vicinamibacterales bacterium]
MLNTLLLAGNLLMSTGVADCEGLKSVSLPDTTILSAAMVPAGEFTPPSAGAAATPRPIQIPVPTCRVAGVVKPAVNFEVWMPAEGWNGKFQGVGGGG